MNRIDRLNALLIHLQGKPRVTMAELEERFGMVRRTLFRDIRALMDAGVPIGGDAGAGYFIVEGYHLPPVVFDKNEATALLMGAKFVEKNADPQTAQAFAQAMYKVKAVLRMSDKDFLDSLDRHVTVMARPQAETDRHLAAIQTAIANHRVIAMNYQRPYHDDPTLREVEPLGLVFYAAHWHLVGYCRMRQALRDFRTDRMQRVEVRAETFDPATHPDYLDFVMQSLAGSDAQEAVIRCSRKVARYMGEQKHYHGFVGEEAVGDDIRMRFATGSYDFLARWLLMFGDEVVVEGPQALQEQMAGLVRELVEHYGVREEKIL
jgi:predicted DNA-binding transcriptional regulator YafY